MALNCYTYKVEVIVNVLAESEEDAIAKMDQGRGEVASQTKTLTNTVVITVDQDIYTYNRFNYIIRV